MNILRARIQNPRISLYVKELDISVEKWHPQIYSYVDDQIDIALVKNLYLTLSKEWSNPSTVDSEFNVQEDFSWLKDEIMTPCFAIMVKTFIHISDLELPVSIENELWDTFRAFPGGDLVEGIRPSHNVLPQLRRLHLREIDCECIFESSRCFPEHVFWMLHPTLEKIHITFDEATESESPLYSSYIQGTHGKSNVQVMTFQWGIRWPTVDALLKLPNHLAEVHFFDVGKSDTISPGRAPRYTRTISDALLSHATSLRVLEFHSQDGFLERIEEFQFAGILPQFTKLERLGLPIDFFLGYTPPGNRLLYECLPTSLLELVIFTPACRKPYESAWRDIDRRDALLKGLSHIQARCPGIRKISCLCFDSEVWFWRLKWKIKDPYISEILTFED
ncbi:hypothetical protein CPB86DRAFT_865390 [Serendipita vermifera]|nr:hypothetical protein CPB86DRAFT_865390 [Serendipita vermifera]